MQEEDLRQVHLPLPHLGEEVYISASPLPRRITKGSGRKWKRKEKIRIKGLIFIFIFIIVIVVVYQGACQSYYISVSKTEECVPLSLLLELSSELELDVEGAFGAFFLLALTCLLSEPESNQGEVSWRVMGEERASNVARWEKRRWDGVQ